MEISLYFTRHTRRSTIESFMNQAGVTRWEVTDDGDLQAFATGRRLGTIKGKPILFFEKNNQPLVVDECKSVYYNTISGRFWVGQPKLAQTIPYSFVTIGVILFIFYILCKIL